MIVREFQPRKATDRIIAINSNLTFWRTAKRKKKKRMKGLGAAASSDGGFSSNFVFGGIVLIVVQSVFAFA